MSTAIADTIGLKIKPWKELTIRDNFMFQKVLRNKRLCKRFIEKTLQIKVKRIIYLETEKSIDEKYSSKSVRIDVFVETDSGELKSRCLSIMVLFDLEQQQAVPFPDSWRKAISDYEGL